MAKQGVESATGQLAFVLQVKIGVVCLDVGETIPPFGLLNPTQFLALDFCNDTRCLVRVVRRGRELGQSRVHRLRQQFLTQARGVRWATIVSHPLQKQAGIEVNAMRVQATVGAVGGHVAALWVAVGVLCAIGADDARPALAIGFGQQQTLLGQPRHDVIRAIVGQADGAQGEGVGLDWCDTQGFANVT